MSSWKYFTLHLGDAIVGASGGVEQASCWRFWQIPSTSKQRVEYLHIFLFQATECADVGQA